MIENNEEKLTLILKAISDPTRRALLKQVVQESSMRVTDLAKNHEMSLNAISKHLKVLENSNLIIRQKVGRIHFIKANLEQISLLDDWLFDLKSIWQLRLDRLEEILKKD